MKKKMANEKREKPIWILKIECIVFLEEKCLLIPKMLCDTSRETRILATDDFLKIKFTSEGQAAKITTAEMYLKKKIVYTLREKMQH